ncbi:cytochrome C oxidase subunit IV family protein [Reichenbachiella versicolor]|uniref:cytochrome C oxidase subunit IV family protein n=1 Tax=Reichenbachiella versicolor TaxID=1821036 RepID=UPI000D6E6F5F|nr:cytochrome C oxidase subunit IV family protein [Reichenbachiella versicolor]
MEQEKSTLEVIPADKAKITKIWKVTGYLAAATTVEFIIALGTDLSYSIKTSIFILLTIYKAYYIVSEFMHLGHEKRSLINSIVYPCIFIVWLLIALLIQGEAVFQALLGQ